MAQRLCSRSLLQYPTPPSRWLLASKSGLNHCFVWLVGAFTRFSPASYTICVQPHFYHSHKAVGYRTNSIIKSPMISSHKQNAANSIQNPNAPPYFNLQKALPPTVRCSKHIHAFHHLPFPPRKSPLEIYYTKHKKDEALKLYIWKRLRPHKKRRPKIGRRSLYQTRMTARIVCHASSWR